MQLADSSHLAPVPTLCSNMTARAAYLASFLIVTSFLPTSSSHSHVPAVTDALDIVSKISTEHDATIKASMDFGHIVRSIPSGVFHPTSPSDIAALIRLSLSQPKPFTVAPRGRGHSARGQALAVGGVVVDMRSLHDHDHDHRAGHGRYRMNNAVPGAWVDVGGEQLWIDVLHATLEHDLAPRVWTDYLHITVGGTLSNGGIGGQAFRHGPQISNVHELDVVTGTQPLAGHRSCIHIYKSES